MEQLCAAVLLAETAYYCTTGHHKRLGDYASKSIVMLSNILFSAFVLLLSRNLLRVLGAFNFSDNKLAYAAVMSGSFSVSSLRTYKVIRDFKSARITGII